MGRSCRKKGIVDRGMAESAANGIFTSDDSGPLLDQSSDTPAVTTQPFTLRCALPTTRREFLSAGAAAAAGLALPRREDGSLILRITDRVEVASGNAAAGRPVVIASSNGIRGVKVAYDMLGSGADPLDAVIAGVNIQELDPNDMSVGLGGLPNADGVVQLDASVMHGPSKRAGSVASLEDIATPSLVAKAVMDYTDHVMLVGAGARRFAIEMGFKPQELLTEKSRQYYLRWKANLNADDNWLDHRGDVEIAKPKQPIGRTGARPPMRGDDAGIALQPEVRRAVLR